MKYHLIIKYSIIKKSIITSYLFHLFFIQKYCNFKVEDYQFI